MSVAVDGEGAIERLVPGGRRGRAATPRLVLLDLRLPGMGGLAVLRRIRADPRTADVQVVVLAAPRADRDITDAYAAGADAFVFKPLEFGQFVEATSEIGLHWQLVATAGMPEKLPARAPRLVALNGG